MYARTCSRVEHESSERERVKKRERWGERNRYFISLSRTHAGTYIRANFTFERWSVLAKSVPVCLTSLLNATHSIQWQRTLVTTWFTPKNENGNKLPPISVFNPKQYNLSVTDRPFLIESVVKAFWEYSYPFIFTNASFLNVAFETFIRVVKNKLIVIIYTRICIYI